VNRLRLFLDCGAYSAWQRGGTIDLGSYIACVQNNHQHLELYLSLDQIPGQYGRRTTDPKVIEAAARQSYENHRAMKAAGLNPVPTFHQDDDFRWLETYLADGEPIICIAAHGVHPTNNLPWYDQCYLRLRDQPGVKVHALGETKLVALRRYHFASVDSKTWAAQAGYGRIVVPVYSRGKPDFTLRPRFVPISNRSGMRRQHFDAQSAMVQEQVDRFLTEEVGVSLDEVRQDTEGCHARWWVCATYYREFARAMGTTIFLVTDGRAGEMRDTLLRCGVNTHLLSYYELRRRQSALAEYVDGHRRK
jgi:hypothetical protein